MTSPSNAGGPVSPSTVKNDPGLYDHAKRRRALRKGREKGCSIYIPAVELKKAGFNPADPPPYYRVWGSRRGITIRLYTEE